MAAGEPGPAGLHAVKLAVGEFWPGSDFATSRGPCQKDYRVRAMQQAKWKRLHATHFCALKQVFQRWWWNHWMFSIVPLNKETNSFSNTTLRVRSILMGMSTLRSLTWRDNSYGAPIFCLFLSICLIKELEKTTWKGVDLYTLFSCFIMIAS